MPLLSDAYNGTSVSPEREDKGDGFEEKKCELEKSGVSVEMERDVICKGNWKKEWNKLIYLGKEININGGKAQGTEFN